VYRYSAATTLVPECRALAADVDALSADALRLWADQLQRWARFVQNATAAVRLSLPGGVSFNCPLCAFFSAFSVPEEFCRHSMERLTQMMRV
jgi:hypothetical protein